MHIVMTMHYFLLLLLQFHNYFLILMIDVLNLPISHVFELYQFNIFSISIIVLSFRNLFMVSSYSIFNIFLRKVYIFNNC
jgi:hypothetical protein